MKQKATKALNDFGLQIFCTALSNSNGFTNTILHTFLQFGTSWLIEEIADWSQVGLEYTLDQILDHETRNHFLVKGGSEILSGISRIFFANLVDFSSPLKFAQDTIDNWTKNPIGFSDDSHFTSDLNSIKKNFSDFYDNFSSALGLQSCNPLITLPSQCHGILSILKGGWTIIKGIYNYFTSTALTESEIKSLLYIGGPEVIKIMNLEINNAENFTESELLEAASKQILKKTKIIADLKDNSSYANLSNLLPIFLESKNCQELKNYYSSHCSEESKEYKNATKLIELEGEYLACRHLQAMSYYQNQLEFLLTSHPECQEKLLQSVFLAKQLAPYVTPIMLQEDEKQLGIQIPQDENGSLYANIIAHEYIFKQALELFYDSNDFASV